MKRLRRTFGIIGVLLMLVSSMGAAAYAQEDGVTAPLETAGTDDSAGDVGGGGGDTPVVDSAGTDGGGEDPGVDEPAPAAASEETPEVPVSAPSAPPPSGVDADLDDEPATQDETIPPPVDDAVAPFQEGAAPQGNPSSQGDGASAKAGQEAPDTSVETHALDVGEPDGNASVAITGLSLSCGGIATFSTVVDVTYERFEGHLILDIYEGDPAGGGVPMATVFPSQGESLLGGSTAYTEDLGWSTSIHTNPYVHVRWVLTAWSGPTGMDYVGEWRGSESAGMSGSCADPGDGDPTDPGDGDPTEPGDPPYPGEGLTSIDAGCDGVLNIEAGSSVEILAVATANGSGVGGMWRFSAVPGQYTRDFWDDDDPAATADDVVFAVYELNEYDEPLNTFYTTLSCSGKPFYDVEQFDLTCEGVLTVAYGERWPEFPLYSLYDGETGERIGSSRSFNGTDFAVEPGVYDSLYVIGEDNWPTLPVYFIAEATVTGCLGGDPGPDPDETGQIALSLTLQDGSGNPDTSADGATASWTVEAAGSVASNPSINGLRAAQPDPSTYTAILDGGAASTTTGPLPLGTYQVCLDNTLTGGPNGDVAIGDSPACDTVELTEAGTTTPGAAAFTATIQDSSTDPDPGDGDDNGTDLNVVSVAITSPNLCTFMGGTATVTGTTQVEGYDPTMRADLAVGWETPGGPVTWGSAHQGPGGTWVDRILEVNGPWSITKAAWDPVIGGKDVGVPRPADATAVFVSLELRERLTAEPDAALTVRYSLANCGLDPVPDPDGTEQIELTLALQDASGNPDASADGATASWTVEPVGPVASNPNINGFRAAQSAASYTAVLAGSMASTTTGPLSLGTYRVCLDNTLTGGPNGDVAIGDEPVCDTVALTETGATTPAVAGFTASIQGAGSAAGQVPADDGQPAASTGGVSARTAPSQTSSAASTGAAPAPIGQAPTTLPVTGAGPAAGGTLALLWLMVASTVFAAAGFAIRRRATA